MTLSYSSCCRGSNMVLMPWRVRDENFVVLMHATMEIQELDVDDTARLQQISPKLWRGRLLFQMTPLFVTLTISRKGSDCV